MPILGGTPEAAVLLEAGRTAGRPTAFIEDQWRQGKAYYARTQWPPGYSVPAQYRQPAKRIVIDAGRDLIARLKAQDADARAAQDAADDAECLTVTYNEVTR